MRVRFPPEALIALYGDVTHLCDQLHRLQLFSVVEEVCLDKVVRVIVILRIAHGQGYLLEVFHLVENLLVLLRRGHLHLLETIGVVFEAAYVIKGLSFCVAFLKSLPQERRIGRFKAILTNKALRS